LPTVEALAPAAGTSQGGGRARTYLPQGVAGLTIRGWWCERSSSVRRERQPRRLVRGSRTGL